MQEKLLKKLLSNLFSSSKKPLEHFDGFFVAFFQNICYHNGDIFIYPSMEFNLIDREYQEAIDILTHAIKKDGIEEYIINFKADYSNSKIIRDFVGTIFDTFDIHHPWRGRFILIADELVNNAIEHGSLPEDIDQCIIVAGRKEDDEKRFFISFEVHDTGK